MYLLGLLSLALWQFPSAPVNAATLPAIDHCAKFANKTFIPPSDALACIESFPFNETLRQNVLTVVERVFNFYTFEDYYLNSPAPFQESTVNIRAELARINSTEYASDYAFNRDLYDFVNQLNDGHTLWFPNCYATLQNLMPALAVSIEVDGIQGVYIAPDLDEFIPLLGPDFTGYFDSIKFDWKRLAGAKVLKIEGQDPYDYVDHVAKTQMGTYLDHGVRVNSVFSSYEMSEVDFSYEQHFGGLAGPLFPDRNNLTFELITANSTLPETVTVPYLTSYFGANVTDAASYWTNNCVATSSTNGADNRPSGAHGTKAMNVRRPMGVIQKKPAQGFGLPPTHLPGLSPLNGSVEAIKAYILPDKKTGVIFVGTFSPLNFTGFQVDVDTAITSLKKAGVTKLLLDVTNNGGGYVCLGAFLFQYLAGAQIGYPGFQSTSRGNPLAQKILASDIAQGLNGSYTFYTGDNFGFLNDTAMPASYNYYKPPAPLTVNGVNDFTSQRYHDACTASFSVTPPTTPAFKPSDIALVSNGACASTCALFTTLMYEKLGTKIGIFGGRPGQSIEYKGMAGNQVLEWFDLDSEIKTAGLKNDPLAPPDLLVNANIRHNWRAAWSSLDEKTPIAYRSEHPQYQFAYTKDTYMNPQNVWAFAAKEIFGGQY